MAGSARGLAATVLVASSLLLSVLPVSGAQATVPAPGAVIVRTWTPIPSYSAAKTDEPITYANGCHVNGSVTVPRVCTFSSGTRTVMLSGDSHANHWFGAVLNAGKVGGWRMKTLTKSGCPLVVVPVRRYKSTNAYPECQTWRKSALAGLSVQKWGRVDVLVISSWQFHQVLTSTYGSVLTGSSKLSAWEGGLRKALTSVLKGVRQVIVLRDSPDLPGDYLQAQRCYATYGLAAQTKCGTTYSKAMSSGIWAAERRAVASFPGRVVAVDLTTAHCPNSWCGPIDGPYLAFKDDNHWTQTWVKARQDKPVFDLVRAAMRRSA